MIPMMFPVGILARYNINNAVLFSVGSFLSRTPAASNRKTWTYSWWEKRAVTGKQQDRLSAYGSNDDNGYFSVIVSPTDQYACGNYTGGVTVSEVAVKRDPAAWSHHVFVHDTTQAIGANRYKFYVDDVLQAHSSTIYGTQNFDGAINSAIAHYIGRNGLVPTTYDAEDYLADIQFIDGLALTPADFGEISTVTGNWIAKRYLGTYPANSFYLDFSNPAALGTDASGNGNDWTVNGTGLVQVTSTPTNVAATWNPLDNAPGASVHVMSNGNRDVTLSGTGAGYTRATLYIPSEGKWVWMIKVLTTGAYFIMGMKNKDATITPPVDNSNDAIVYRSDTGQKGDNGVWSAFGATWGAVNDIIRAEFDVAANSLEFFKNNVSQGTMTPPTGISWVPFIDIAVTNGAKVSTAFNPDDFFEAPSTDFLALTTDNLPTRSPKTPTTPQTGSFTGNANADGPCINLGMAIDQSGTSTINGNTITWGTHADALAIGVKLRTALATYNASGANTYSFAVKAYTGGSNVDEANGQAN